MCMYQMILSVFIVQVKKNPEDLWATIAWQGIILGTEQKTVEARRVAGTRVRALPVARGLFLSSLLYFQGKVIKLVACIL